MRNQTVLYECSRRSLFLIKKSYFPLKENPVLQFKTPFRYGEQKLRLLLPLPLCFLNFWYLEEKNAAALESPNDPKLFAPALLRRSEKRSRLIDHEINKKKLFIVLSRFYNISFLYRFTREHVCGRDLDGHCCLGPRNPKGIQVFFSGTGTPRLLRMEEKRETARWNIFHGRWIDGSWFRH